MTYRDESSQLARELARLAVTGSSRTLDAAGFDVALVGRRETLTLLRQVLSDATGTSRDGTGIVATRDRSSPLRSLQEVQAHPVAVLSRTLASHPTLAPRQAPSDSMAAETEGGWSRVARHGLLAGHDWSTRPPRPSPEQQWSAVADVAALAQAVTILDRDLLEAARRLDDVDPAVVRALDAATVSGLRVAAQEASALGAYGTPIDKMLSMRPRG